MELRPSTELSRTDVAQLFTAAYEGYFIPFRVEEARLEHIARARIAAARTEPEPWQRDDTTVDNLADVTAVTVAEALREAGATHVLTQLEMLVTL